MRYSPAGIPVVEFSLGHTSRQEEAAEQRKVECEVPCLLLGLQASLLNTATLGAPLTVSGFLAAKSLKNRALVLHVIEIEFIEGNENGIQTEIRSE